MASGDLDRELVDRLDEVDRRRVASSIGLPADVAPAKLAPALALFVKAALAEYLDLFPRRRVPGRIAGHEQNRLLLYVAEHVFEGRRPGPDVVADLFQKTTAASKTLVGNTATRFRHEISPAINAPVWTIMLGAHGDGDDWVVEIHDLAMVAHTHELIRRRPGNPPGTKALTTELHAYELAANTTETLLPAIGR